MVSEIRAPEPRCRGCSSVCLFLGGDEGVLGRGVSGQVARVDAAAWRGRRG